MSWLTTIIEDLNLMVIKPVSASLVRKILSVPADELDIFTQQQEEFNSIKYLDAMSEEMLDQYAADVGLTRNYSLGTRESDASLKSRIRVVFEALNVAKKYIVDGLTPYSHNIPVVEERMADCWYIGGEETDLYSRSYLGVSTICQAEEFQDNLTLVSSSASSRTYQSKRVYPNVMVSSQWFRLDISITYLANNMFTYKNSVMDDKGIFEVGRPIRVVGGSVFDTVVTGYTRTQAGDVVVTVESTNLDSSISTVWAYGDTIYVWKASGTVVYMWQSWLQEDGTFTISDSNRADLRVDLLNYLNMDDTVITFVDTRDGKYTLEIIISSGTIKYGQGIKYGEYVEGSTTQRHVYGEIGLLFGIDFNTVVSGLIAAGIKYNIMVHAEYTEPLNNNPFWGNTTYHD